MPRHAAVCAQHVSLRQIHGNVCMRAVVVTPQLDWRLHAFDLLCEAGGPPLGSSEPWPLAAGAWAIGSQYKAAEVRVHSLCKNIDP